MLRGLVEVPLWLGCGHGRGERSATRSLILLARLASSRSLAQRPWMRLMVPAFEWQGERQCDRREFVHAAAAQFVLRMHPYAASAIVTIGHRQVPARHDTILDSDSQSVTCSFGDFS
ncbi:uncharacterized protein EI97DRAFT_245695 [Westerdykella ornata]|uniref:Uncharacterized protein n=1 Tax=Westerdykella ornata TaxID=318751 RepID=A0A6A6JNN2_WESOR|nr:uncharacterized protein EI97DRAFT_245695 [Westerdykella ornata]KAF2278122.1 hypothetical protein EI97DRAFT_245695 [Westerdykella ornata]